MRNTAIRIAALGAALTTLSMTPALAEGRQENPAQQDTAVSSEPAAAAAEAEPITTKTGKPVTLEILKNEAEWRKETAEMLERESPRRTVR